MSDDAIHVFVNAAGTPDAGKRASVDDVWRCKALEERGQHLKTVTHFFGSRSCLRNIVVGLLNDPDPRNKQYRGNAAKAIQEAIGE